jgi:hypothetical protein
VWYSIGRMTIAAAMRTSVSKNARHATTLSPSFG